MSKCIGIALGVKQSIFGRPPLCAKFARVAARRGQAAVGPNPKPLQTPIVRASVAIMTQRPATSLKSRNQQVGWQSLAIITHSFLPTLKLLKA
jgi:hypothetical protein